MRFIYVFYDLESFLRGCLIVKIFLLSNFHAALQACSNAQTVQSLSWERNCFLFGLLQAVSFSKPHASHYYLATLTNSDKLNSAMLSWKLWKILLQWQWKILQSWTSFGLLWWWRWIRLMSCCSNNLTVFVCLRPVTSVVFIFWGVSVRFQQNQKRSFEMMKLQTVSKIFVLSRRCRNAVWSGHHLWCITKNFLTEWNFRWWIILEPEKSIFTKRSWTHTKHQSDVWVVFLICKLGKRSMQANWNFNMIFPISTATICQHLHEKDVNT